MRALTVQQPWAWAIIHGGKDIENRSRNIAGSYRGSLAIHAGQHLADGAAFDTVLRLAPGAEAGLSVLAAGAIVGVVDLERVVGPDTCPDTDGATCSPWCIPGHHHLWLANPRPLTEPIRCKGRLGLWTPTPDVLAQLEPAITQESR